MFTYETDCRRKAFRLCPTEADPIIINFKGKNVSLIEISAGGTSFNNRGFKKGDSQNVHFSLEGQPLPVTALLEVVGIADTDICHCRFKEMDTESEETIHKYVLHMQRKYLSAKRTTASGLPRAKT